MSNDDIVEADRKAWLMDNDFASPTIDPNSQAALHEHEHRPCGPSLRKAGYRISDGSLTSYSGEPAEKLRQTHVKIDGSFESPAQQIHDAISLVVARQARRADCSVVRPNRSVVIRHWIKEDFIVG